MLKYLSILLLSLSLEASEKPAEYWVCDTLERNLGILYKRFEDTRVSSPLPDTSLYMAFNDLLNSYVTLNCKVENLPKTLHCVYSEVGKSLGKELCD